MKTTRCTDCAAEFTDEELEGVSCCPKCGSKGVPCLISQDVNIKINWHELRILTIWASNWANKLEADSQRALKSILKRLEAQRPVEFPALTLLDEIKELPVQLKKMGIECGPVEFYEGDRRIFPPDHELN